MKAILHNIRSLHNVGSMFRTADAAGIEKLFLTGFTPAPIDEWGRVRSQLTKVSLGAEKTVAWEKHTSATQLIKNLKKDGDLVVAIEQHSNAISLFEFLKIKEINNYIFSVEGNEKRNNKKDNKDNVVLAMGNEVCGLSPAVLALADHIMEIPMRGKKESLNVAVAFGIVAYWFPYARKTFEHH